MNKPYHYYVVKICTAGKVVENYGPENRTEMVKEIRRDHLRDQDDPDYIGQALLAVNVGDTAYNHVFLLYTIWYGQQNGRRSEWRELSLEEKKQYGIYPGAPKSQMIPWGADGMPPAFAMVKAQIDEIVEKHIGREMVFEFRAARFLVCDKDDIFARMDGYSVAAPSMKVAREKFFDALLVRGLGNQYREADWGATIIGENPSKKSEFVRYTDDKYYHILMYTAGNGKDPEVIAHRGTKEQALARARQATIEHPDNQVRLIGIPDGAIFYIATDGETFYKDGQDLNPIHKVAL